MVIVFHTEALKGMSFAQEKFWDRLLVDLCERSIDLTWDRISMMLCCFIWVSLTTAFHYLVVLVQYICKVWWTCCDICRVSAFVHHKQIWREAQEDSFSKGHLELDPHETYICPTAFSFFLCMNDQELLLHLEAQGRCKGQSWDTEVLLSWRWAGGWRGKCRGRCQRGQRKRKGGKLERKTKTRIYIFSTPTVLPGFLMAANLKSNPVHFRQCQFHSVYWTILNWKRSEVSDFSPKSQARD